MKKVLLLLGCCAGLASCTSTPEKKAEMTATERANSQENPEATPNALNEDSMANAKLSAVAHQPQIDTALLPRASPMARALNSLPPPTAAAATASAKSCSARPTTT
jgi:hypothetical protein